MSYDLATIKRDVPMDICIDDLKYKEVDHEKLNALYEELEFYSFIKKEQVKTEEKIEYKIIQNIEDIKIKDLLAVDTFVPQRIKGGLAGEFMLENAVGLAVMVGTEKNQMENLARLIKSELGIEVEVGRVEADMAIKGALTTQEQESHWL